MSFLQELVLANKQGAGVGIYSCCSANEEVIRAVCMRAHDTQTRVLIESTANQVNQLGGYTGMTPQDFARFVRRVADEVGLPWDQVILGGDHLGPLPWTQCAEEEALQRAEALVGDCIRAGYTKIHLDTSMRVASDDPARPFATEVCARRGARLAAACEKAFAEFCASEQTAGRPMPDAPLYVIGSEVPVPGGDVQVSEMGVTNPADALKTIAAYHEAFDRLGLQEAFSRVIALVVEMGVEFHEWTIDEYDRSRTRDIVAALRETPLAIEGHSTDYQTTQQLRHMCEDGVAILKVGPAFTFALREVLFALEHIEQELYAGSETVLSDFRSTLDATMVANSKNWESYCPGTDSEQRLGRAFSYYDRARYYLYEKPVRSAQECLMKNLSGNVIPATLLSQYLPVQYAHFRQGKLANNEPRTLVLDFIGMYIDPYLQACAGSTV